MKRIILLLTLIALTLVAILFTNFLKPEKTVINDKIQCDGCWSYEATELSPESKEIFTKAAPEYEPLLLIGTQVVAGMNYQYLAKKDNQLYILTIYQDLQNNCQITDIKSIS